MKTPLRIDYAAEGHPMWLYRLDDKYMTIEAAVKMAQERLDKWPRMVGFRIVELEHPVLQKMTEAHFGKIIDLDGKMTTPWEVETCRVHVS